MNVSRRAVIGGIAATPLAAAPAMTAPDDIQYSNVMLDAMTRVHLNLDRAANMLPTGMGTALINTRLVMRAPQFFHPNNVMWMPTQFIDVNGDLIPKEHYDGSVHAADHVSARSRALNQTFSLELMTDAKQQGDEHLVRLLDQVIDELVYEWTEIERKGIRVYPYWPLTPVRAIQPDSFAPIIGWKTRFGVRDGEQV